MTMRKDPYQHEVTFSMVRLPLTVSWLDSVGAVSPFGSSMQGNSGVLNRPVVPQRVTDTVSQPIITVAFLSTFMLPHTVRLEFFNPNTAFRLALGSTVRLPSTWTGPFCTAHTPLMSRFS